MGTKKKRLIIISAILLTVIFAYLIIALMPRGKNYPLDNPMMKPDELPYLIAHGGGNKEFPDNTLEAFYNAYSVDRNAVMETDVSITKDGVVILSHDTTLDRKTNVTGAIADWSYSDLIAEEVNFGYDNPTENETLSGERKIYTDGYGNEKSPLDVEYPEGISARHDTVFLATTLEELLTAFPDNLISVEIKQEGETGFCALGEVLRLLREYDAFDRVILASFHGEIYDELVRLDREGEVPEGFIYSPYTGGVVKYFLLYVSGLDVFFRDGICALQIPTNEYGINLALAGLVKNAHRHNIAVHYWTVNDKDEMRRLVEIGADGITTDYPHRLAEIYAEYAKQ